MAGDATFLPTYESDPEFNTGILRQSIPMMAKHNISPHPINYAIWYDYASGQNTRLKNAVDQIVEKGLPFDNNVSLDLYATHVCNASISGFEKINFNLQSLLDKTSTKVSESGTQVGDVNDKVRQSATRLNTVEDAADLQSVLAGIVSETSQLLSVSESLKNELQSAHQEMEQLKQELTKVREMATTDALTGLLNRRAFDTELSGMVDAGIDSSEHALMILDLDHFKRINDTYGHLVGDKVIRYMAMLLKKHVATQHWAARYGGEEMAVIMPHTTLEQAASLAETIRAGLAGSQLKQKENGMSLGKITVSIGLAALQSSDTVESFIARADDALYKAKQNGRNQVVTG